MSNDWFKSWANGLSGYDDGTTYGAWGKLQYDQEQNRARQREAQAAAQRSASAPTSTPQADSIWTTLSAPTSAIDSFSSSNVSTDTSGYYSSGGSAHCSSGSSSRSIWPWIILVAIVFIVAGALSDAGSKPSKPAAKPAPWVYSFNAATYHDGTGTEVAKTKPSWTKEARLLETNRCTRPPCYTLVITEGKNPSSALPSQEEMESSFGEQLQSRAPQVIYGHLPYRYRGDLFRYELPKQLWYGQLARTGFGWYDKDYSDRTKKHVEQFLSSSDRGQVINCFYATGNPRTAFIDLYWYQSRPSSADPNVLRSRFPDHPLLKIKGPVQRCPLRRG